MKGSDFLSDCVDLLYSRFQKISLESVDHTGPFKRGMELCVEMSAHAQKC